MSSVLETLGDLMTDIKYSIYAFQASFEFSEFKRTYFGERTHIQSLRPSEIFKDADVEHWKAWMGTTDWEEFSDCPEIILSWMPTSSPAILDNENTILDGQCHEVYRALPTVTGHCFSFCKIHIVSGSGKLINGEVSPTDIRSSGTLDPYVKSLWIDSDRGGLPFKHDEVLARWVENHRLIQNEVINKSSAQLLEAVRSLEESFKTYQLEFKIPNLVRAVESLVVCWTAKEFAEFVSGFTGTPPKTEFDIHLDYISLLRNLYELRNDCSHGKPFAYSLKKKFPGVDLNLEVPRYEYLAEWIAQTIFFKSLRHKDIHFFENRELLEKAWKDRDKNFKNNV